MKNPIRPILPILVIFLFVCFSGIHSCGPNESANPEALPVSTPEAEGIASTGILQFLDAVEKGENEFHSYIIVRHGKVVSEGWWRPYAKDLRHVMYSVSKSFTSIGVGIAISENKLALTDKVASFFPQSIPDSASMYMQEMTVQDLLKMSTGMDSDPLFAARGSADNWPTVFLSSTVEHKPGTVFKYNNMASFMLSAIVQKVTGETLFDYLKARLFDPLGIRNVTWDEAPGGYTFGAIGLRLPSEDMAKFGQLLLQKGKWNGQQIIPESWVEEATSFQIESSDPANPAPKELNDWAQGYGYQFWVCRNNAYRADGLGGQFIIVLPEKDAVVVLTCAAINTQEVLDLVWDNLLPAMEDHPLPKDKHASDELAQRIASLSVSETTSSVSDVSSSEVMFNGSKIAFVQNNFGIQALHLVMADSSARIQIDRDNAQFEIIAGLNNWIISETGLHTLAEAPGPAQVRKIKVASTYSLIDSATFEFTSRFVEESIRSEAWTLRFEENGPEITVHVEIKELPAGIAFGRPPEILKGRVAN